MSLFSFHFDWTRELIFAESESQPCNQITKIHCKDCLNFTFPTLSWRASAQTHVTYDNFGNATNRHISMHFIVFFEGMVDIKHVSSVLKAPELDVHFLFNKQEMGTRSKS